MGGGQADCPALGHSGSKHLIFSENSKRNSFFFLFLPFLILWGSEGYVLLFIHSVMITLLRIGTTEIIVIVLLVLLLFGGKKIPELMKGLGKGVRSFKEGMSEIEKDPAEKTDSSAKAEDSSTDNVAQE